MQRDNHGMQATLKRPARSRRRLLPLPILLLLSGCGGTTVEIAADGAPLCKALARPVCVSADDKLTEGTARDILRVNEGIRGGCPGVVQACPKGQKPAPAPAPAAKAEGPKLS